MHFNLVVVVMAVYGTDSTMLLLVCGQNATLVHGTVEARVRQ